MIECDKCKWPLPETCRACKAEQREERLEQRIYGVVDEIVKTRQVDLELIRTVDFSKN